MYSIVVLYTRPPCNNRPDWIELVCQCMCTYQCDRIIQYSIIIYTYICIICNIRAGLATWRMEDTYITYTTTRRPPKTLAITTCCSPPPLTTTTLWAHTCSSVTTFIHETSNNQYDDNFYTFIRHLSVLTFKKFPK